MIGRLIVESWSLKTCPLDSHPLPKNPTGNESVVCRRRAMVGSILPDLGRLESHKAWTSYRGSGHARCVGARRAENIHRRWCCIREQVTTGMSRLVASMCRGAEGAETNRQEDAREIS